MEKKIKKYFQSIKDTYSSLLARVLTSKLPHLAF